LERMEKMSHDKIWTLEAAIKEAGAAGWRVEAFQMVPGTTGYQLKSPDGDYVQFGGSEENVWRKAFERGLFNDFQSEVTK